MRIVKLSVYHILLIYLTFFQIPSIMAQTTNEAQIQSLEHQQTEAILKGDTVTLFKLFSPEMVVNSPNNHSVTLTEVKKYLKAGQINYSSYVVTIEKITFANDVAIVMGQEVTKPIQNTKNAGKTVTRRFTNIWMKKDNSWKMIARQATDIMVVN